MTQILRPPVAADDFDGASGIDGSNGKETLAERLMALGEAAGFLGSIATASLPTSLAHWQARDFDGIPAAGIWAWDTTQMSPVFWDGTAWRGASGSLTPSATARLFTVGPVAAKGTTEVHALIDTAAITDTTTGFTNPDVPRNLRVTKAASWDGGTVTVTGTDQFDQAVEEVFPALGAGLEVGVKIFKTVTASRHSIALAGGNGYSIGCGDKVGLPADVANTVGLGYVGTTIEAVTMDATYSAFTPTTTPAATTYLVLANIAAP